MKYANVILGILSLGIKYICLKTLMKKKLLNYSIFNVNSVMSGLKKKSQQKKLVTIAGGWSLILKNVSFHFTSG